MKRIAFFSPVVLAGLVFSLAVNAQGDGTSIATLVVPKDTPSSAQAIVVGQLLRQGYARNPRYAVLDLEVFLENDENPPARRRLRQADEALERGRAAFSALELSPAIELFAEALVGMEQSAAALDDLAPVLEVLRLQGAAYAMSGDEVNARRAFERLLALEPGAVLRDARIPETVYPTFEDARERAATQGTGTLTVYAAPPAAEVWVDGRFRGSAPLSVDNLPVGRHFVRVVRDGYQAFGTAVDVGSFGEETVQATLRPTARLAEFDEYAARMSGGSEPGAAGLAAKMKVEQLLWAVVETAGDDVTIAAALTDGVSGAVVTRATKTFVFNSPRFRGDVELWIAQSFRQGTASVPANDMTTTSGKGNGFLPDKPLEQPTPPKTIIGWSLIGTSAVGLGVGVGFGVYSLYWFDVYKNGGRIFGQTPVPNQLHPGVTDARNGYIVSSVVADAGYLVFGAALVGGISLVLAGNFERAEIEDVLSDTTSISEPRLGMGIPLHSVGE